MDRLLELLAHNRTYDPNYRGKLSNHGSMSLLALYYLGATKDHLSAFYKDYAKNLDPIHDSQLLTIAGQWEQKINQQGISEVLRVQLPQLLVGLGGDAFHGWIRLAYAVEFAQHSSLSIAAPEIGLALAHFERCQLIFPLPPTSAREANPARLIDELHALALPKIVGRTITERMPISLDDPRVAELATALQAGPTTLSQLAAIALDTYLHHREFASLHLVTATHATRILSPFVDLTSLLQAFWVPFIGTMRMLGANPPLAPLNSPHDWPTVIHIASNTFDDHISKFIYSCHEEMKVYGNSHYLVAANHFAQGG